MDEVYENGRYIADSIDELGRMTDIYIKNDKGSFCAHYSFTVFLSLSQSFPVFPSLSQSFPVFLSLFHKEKDL